MKKGILEVKCLWVNGNAFYWHCIESELFEETGLFRDKTIKKEIKIHKFADISSVFDFAEKLQWEYEIFNLELDKTML